MAKTSLTVFSSTGRLTQIDYANNSVASSNPVIGIKTKNGVMVIANSNKNIELGEQSKNSKIFLISRNIGITGSGLQTDLRVLVKKARKIARNFQNNFGETISVKQLIKELSNFIQEFTHSGGVRPFGVSIFIIGFDNFGPNLFQVDPSGSFSNINLDGIGKNSNLAIDFLKRRWDKDLGISDCIRLGLIALQETSDFSISKNHVQIGLIEKNCIFYILNQKQIENFIETLKKN